MAKRCGDCIHYDICGQWVDEQETFPEMDGGCPVFKSKDGMKWIPVSERLPNTFGEYIVACKDAFGEVYSDYADYDPFAKRWKTGLFLDNGESVTHWMPLPEPPKGE